jgi:hypothetical protein
VAVLQQLADGRAAALMAADLGELAAVELTGSPAYETDRQNIERLRGQQQGYLDLILVVRSADVTSVTSEAVVLRAVVDRSAYRVVTEGGDAQAIEAAPGEPLTYTVARGDGGWRLTEVGPP